MEKLILTPSKRRQAVLEVLGSARKHVVLSLFRCDDSPVLDEIIATTRRGIDVKVLFTPRARGWNKRLGGLATLLKDTGVNVRQYDGPWSKYHAKYVIADDELAIVGSMNLTRKCFEDTSDFVFMTRKSAVVLGLRKLFDADWNYPETAAPEDQRELIIGPDHTRNRMLRILEQAKFKIRIVDHRVSHPAVLVLLGRKMREGVSVRILGRNEVGNFTSHGKMVLIDEDLAVIGSASLSRRGLEIRREVSVVIEESSSVNELSRFFEEMAVGSASRADKPRNSRPDDDDEDDEDDED